LRLLVTNHVWQQRAGGALGDKAILNNRDLCQALAGGAGAGGACMIPVARAAHAEGSDVLTKISTNSSVITLINVFTVEPANQQRLVELLTEATEDSVCRAPGFVSASSIAVQTAQRSTMHAQWQAAIEFEKLNIRPHRGQLLGIDIHAIHSPWGQTIAIRRTSVREMDAVSVHSLHVA
jgi:Antibiotic biosynthesis monooxygenase